MQVTKNAVVTMDYTLKGNDGQVIDSSKSPGREPMVYIHGVNHLVPGLEKALEQKGPGEEFSVAVPPEEGYGARDERLVSVVPKSAFGNNPIMVGARFGTTDKQGRQREVVVTKIEADSVTIDANHRLAGQTLNFEVTIKDVREAQQEELEHGHVHGAGGHHH
jgi:FKBP-type peptidyl-prolyl cis-trans isomerase SlyD